MWNSITLTPVELLAVGSLGFDAGWRDRSSRRLPTKEQLTFHH
jgi:hypothetical protein